MSKSDLPDVPSFRKQHLLIEYASLKLRCPPGIYLSLNPGDPALWSGVFFVRTGPYASAVLRFSTSFPPQYPDVPPLISFTTDIFHPLIVPLTTYTSSSGASNEESLPPGGFSLRDGFPQWSSRHETAEQPSGIIEVLAYLKRAFEDSDTLDKLPLETAGNSGAWHAWRSHRRLPKTCNADNTLADGEPTEDTAEGLQSQPGDWNWDGVWRNRVNNGIGNSLTDSVLFGPKGARGGKGAGMIRFAKTNQDQLNEFRKEVGGRLDANSRTQPG